MEKTTAENELYYRMIRSMLHTFVVNGGLSVEQAEALRKMAIEQLKPIIGWLDDEVSYGASSKEN